MAAHGQTDVTSAPAPTTGGRRVVLEGGHVQPVWAGHPWVFPQGIASTAGDPKHGDEVDVFDARGKTIGRGVYSEKSAIAVRVFSREPGDVLGRELFEKRFQIARQRRAAMGLPSGGERGSDGYRGFHGEGDGLPGLVIDVFGESLVYQLGSAGLSRHRGELLEAMLTVFEPQTVFERTSEKVAVAERFEAKNGLVWGRPIQALEFVERGFEFSLPLTISQKTGYYFDQRPLRARIEELAEGRSVLDAYSFVGPIGLSARRGGASRVVCVDSSAPAVEVGRRLAAVNGLDVEFEFHKADAARFLIDQKPVWDLVVADPPKLAQSRRGLRKAMKAFRRIAGAAVGATAPGGLVVLSSCSAALGIKELERCLALGAADAGRATTVVDRLFQGADHPVPPAFPEGLYLSTAIAYVE